MKIKRKKKEMAEEVVKEKKGTEEWGSSSLPTGDEFKTGAINVRVCIYLHTHIYMCV